MSLPRYVPQELIQSRSGQFILCPLSQNMTRCSLQWPKSYRNVVTQCVLGAGSMDAIMSASDTIGNKKHIFNARSYFASGSVARNVVEYRKSEMPYSQGES